MDTRSSLIRRVVGDSRDEAAWEEFYTLYFPYIRAIFARKAGPAAELADDFTQDVVTRLIVRLRTFVYDPAKSFRGFLRVCAEHAWIDFVRGRPAPDALSGEALESALGDRARQEYLEQVEEAYKMDLVRVALANLVAAERARVRTDPQCKLHPDAPDLIEPLLLGDLSAEAAAERLGTTAGAVRTQVSRWKDELAGEVKKLSDLDDAGPETPRR